MSTPLPSNDDLESFSRAIPWKKIDRQKRNFNDKIVELRSQPHGEDELPLDVISRAVGVPVVTQFPDSEQGNVILAQIDGHQHVLGSFVSKRYRSGKTLLQSIVPYNANPSVNHTNMHQTDTPTNKMRALGAELELGLFHADGSAPSEEEVQSFMEIYRNNAHKLGITPTVDREACRYQVEVHVAPGIGYHRTRQSLDGILLSLVKSSEMTQLQTAVLAAYPLHSKFDLTPDPKVLTANDVMNELNGQFPQYLERLEAAKTRYHMDSDAGFVQAFRLQGCHIHLDVAGRSEALGLLTFYTMLRSATALANAALLKGSPFVNGTCDPELLCTREYLRSTTVTGHFIESPLSPHLTTGALEKYGNLIHSEKANSVVRAMLYSDDLGKTVSVMHNPIGRFRPDLSMAKRICTLESTGMPVNISGSRQAAVLTDFEFSHAIIEDYFRKHGCDLEPMMENAVLWDILGPLSTADYIAIQNRSDREGTDTIVKTASGAEMALVEFYEKKRRYMHKHLMNIIDVTPRDIDDVYMSLMRMLDPPSGMFAETVEQYIIDPRLRSTGNWGRILRDAFVEEGGTPGTHNPDAVLRVANRVHNSLVQRYS